MYTANLALCQISVEYILSYLEVVGDILLLQIGSFDIIHTVVLIRYIYLLEISVKHNNYCRRYCLNHRTTCFSVNRPSSGPQELNYV